MKPTLILFDIDDTIVRKKHDREAGLKRWSEAILEVYGVSCDVQASPNYNGAVDWEIGLDITGKNGIPLSVYERSFPKLREALYEKALVSASEGLQYVATDGASDFICFVRQKQATFMGLLTGNLEKVGWWKLKQAGLDGYFSFGLFADHVKKRIELAYRALKEAGEYHHQSFSPDKTIIIGDTIHDFACAKAIGAKMVAITCQREGAREMFVAQGANCVIDTLTDRSVYSFVESVVNL